MDKHKAEAVHIFTRHKVYIKKLSLSSRMSNITTMDSKKSNKIREIVRLQQIIKKWRKIANSPKASSITNSNSNSSNKSIKFLKRTLSILDKTSTTYDAHVPKGYLAVCVGDELKRFIIPTDYLGCPAFQFLLREAEEEFGFQQTGLLNIPCEVSIFEELLNMVEENRDTFFMQGCYSESQLNFYHSESPMCR